MDILHLVDRLEALVNEARPFPLGRNRIIIDEDRLIDLIDQMRVSIPEEVRQAQSVIKDRDKVMAQAQEQAERTVRMAQQKATELTDQQQVVIQARRRAEEIIDQARQDGLLARSDADEYVIETLETMESEVMRVLTQVQNGLLKLKSERGQRKPPPAPPLEEDEAEAEAA